MPPKRKSTDAPGPAKKARDGRSPSPETTPEIKRMLNKRWSAVSVTRNADEEFRKNCLDPARGFNFVCLGRLPWNSSVEDSEDEDDEEQRKKDTADVNPEAMLKPAAEFPDEKWIFTNCGIDKYVAVNACVMVRDPDAFGMYVTNDSAGYGAIEIVQNLMLDFEEFKDDWKKQWAVCEATALFFASDCVGPLLGCECGDDVKKLFTAVVRMFLSLLATLERNDLLKPDSEIKNLGALIGLYIRNVVDISDYGIEREGDDERLWAYVAKYGIEVLGVDDEKYQNTSDGTMELAENTAVDPWSFKKRLTAMKRASGKSFGGDHLDITSWTSMDRKMYAFDGKDPLSRHDLAMIKKGGIVS